MGGAIKLMWTGEKAVITCLKVAPKRQILTEGIPKVI